MKVYFRQMIACALIGPLKVWGKNRYCKDCKADKECLDLWKKVQPKLKNINFSNYVEV